MLFNTYMSKSGPVVKLNVPLTSWPPAPNSGHFRGLNKARVLCFSWVLLLQRLRRTCLFVKALVDVAHLAAQIMGLLPAWRSHLHFPSLLTLFYPRHHQANGEGKQQLKQRRVLAHVSRLQLLLFMWKRASSGPDVSLLFPTGWRCLQEIQHNTESSSKPQFNTF